MNALTLGDFDTEIQSAIAFDKFAESYGEFWRIYKEVPGSYVNSLPGSRDGSPRIDRILIPTTKLIECGWECGAIGVEIKPSKQKIGRAISQCIDYRGAAFKIGAGFHVFCDQIFLWPFSTVGGDIESVMAQYRVGGVYHDGFEGTFWLGQQRTLVFRGGSLYELKKSHALAVGKKRGNRG